MSTPLGRCVRLLWHLVPVLVLASVWVPELSHYHVPGVRIDAAAVERARRQPSDAALDEVSRMRLWIPLGFKNERELISTAEHLLQGELRLPHYPVSRIKLPFDPADLTAVVPPVEFASLIVPDLLLDAHRLTGREEFFHSARDVISAFARYEGSAWLPKGYLWNDHAIWARISVLTKFWRIYRVRSDFDSDVAESVLQLLARSGQLLAKPSHFFYRTNHGVMQNAGLLQLCVAFPPMAARHGWCNTAVARLEDQMAYYVNEEGVVMEHSAGYHAFGMELLAMVLRCLTLLDRQIPPLWAEKYRKVKAYYGELRRPDGTLPTYGDTLTFSSIPLVTEIDAAGRADVLRPKEHWRPHASFSLFPVAGHAVWWSGLQNWPQSSRLAQTVVTWANFRSRAHKIADDMALAMWSGGQAWITNTGYWPYGQWGREQSEGWQAANAPHLLDERKDSLRTTDLLGYGNDGLLTIVDLHRRGPAGYSARRQVMQLGSELWLVLDEIQDQSRRTSITTWTLHPSLQANPGPGENSFSISAGGTGAIMHALFLGSLGTELRMFKGSRQPFAGWVVTDREPRPAQAFVVVQPSASSWALAAWSLQARETGPSRGGIARMLEWKGADQWKIQLSLSQERVVLVRSGDAVLLEKGDGGSNITKVQMQRGPNITPDRAGINMAYDTAASKHRKYRELVNYRLKVTYLLLAVLVCQEAVLLFFRRFAPKHAASLQLAGIMAWVIVGVWLFVVYFGT